ncbi:Callose synthase 7 isoform B [Glycine soja]|uniref:Callose synthase 7 isoform B n=1 Tax=Glycine soja TaxID=3848 RepID=A0A445JMJ1_GLYSO|nr:Callose synthase 7 isoform B [Glycine soja]
MQGLRILLIMLGNFRLNSYISWLQSSLSASFLAKARSCLPLDYESLASLISNKFKLFPFAESVFYTKYDFSSTRYTLFWIMLLISKLAFSYYVEILPLVGPTKLIMGLSIDNYQWHEFFPENGQTHNICVVFAIWAPIILVYFMDTQIWYAIYATLLGFIVGAFSHLGEIRTVEMLHSRFQSVPGAFSLRFWTGKDRKTKQVELAETYERNNISYFSQFWNEFINSMRVEDLISDRDRDFLLIPYSSTEVSVIQWPVFLLTSKIPIAVDMAKDYKKKTDDDLYKKIRSDGYMFSAVIECYETLKDIILKLLLDEEDRQAVSSICTKVERCIREETFVKEFKMSGLPSLIEKSEKLLTLLQSDDGKLDSKIANALQDIVEIVIHDVMINGHFFLQKSQQHHVKRGEQFVNINTSFTHNKSVTRKVIRLHLLLTVKESATNVPQNLEARRRITFFANSLFMNMPKAPKVRDMLSVSILTPYFKEDIQYSDEEINKENEEGISILFYLTKIYPDEWSNFHERLKSEEVLEENKEELIRQWASYRGQTLYRTVQITQKPFIYVVSLAALSEGYSETNKKLLEEAQTMADLKFTYVVSCQAYGYQRKSKNARDKNCYINILKLMLTHSSLRVAYIDEIEEKTEDGKSQMVYFSVLIKGGKKYDEESSSCDQGNSRFLSEYKDQAAGVLFLVLSLLHCIKNTQEIMSNTIRIEKFKGKNNFNLWRIKMHALLKEQRVWAPVAFASVKKEVASESKEKLEKVYMTKSICNKLVLKRRLFGLHMKEGTSLKDHLDELSSILIELRDIDVKIEDEDATMILLASLPSSYKSFVNSLSVESNGSGLVVSNSIKNIKKKVFKGKKKTHVNQKDICNYCKEPGHWKKDCPMKKGKPSAVITKEGSTSENEFVLSVADHHQHSENRHVPELKKNLISIGIMDGKGFKCNTENGVMKIQKGSTMVMKGIKRGNLYILQGTTCVEDGLVAFASRSNKSIPDLTQLWHMRLGHMSEKGMMILQKQQLLGNQKLDELKFCEHHVFGKQHRIKFPKAIHTTKGTLDYIHADCWGPTRVPSLGGGRYFLSIIDDYSRMTWIYITSQKSQAFKCFKEWKTLIEKQTERKVKRLKTDNGLEFCSTEFNKFCRDEGIARQLTVRNTRQQNGVVERMNKTLLERTRCLLSSVGLNRSFWEKAINTTCFLINKTPSTAIGLKTPIEIWNGKTTNYSNLRVFGCNAYYHVNEGKLVPRSRKGLFMGYGDGVKGYRIWSPSERKVLLSRDVIFDESHLLHPKIEVPIAGTQSCHSPQEKDVESTTKDSKKRGHTDTSPIPQEGEKLEHSSANEAHQNAEPEPTQFNSGISQRPKRVSKPPERYGFEDMAAYALHVAEEIDSNEPATHVVGCKWIFKRKLGLSEKEGIRNKARLVAKGFGQKEGVDFNEIFSPVVKHTSIWILLAIVANQELELEQLDVKTAFLYGRLEENILMKQLEGFEVQGKESFITSLGFKRSLYDYCVYHNKVEDGSMIYLLLYVDDMLSVAKNMCDKQNLKILLSGEFDMKDLGAAKKILGMEIYRDITQKRLFLSQKDYIQKILVRFGMTDSKPINTPLSEKEKLSAMIKVQALADQDYMSKVPYSSVVGSLMYAMVYTRPDLAYVVSMISRFLNQPQKEHWKAVQRIFRYLKGTTDVWLIYGSNSDCCLTGYSDADFAADLVKKRSLTGYSYTLGGCLVSWKATLQPSVALSTTEAKYMALTEAAKEGIWLRGLINDLRINQEYANIYYDSLSAICFAKDQEIYRIKLPGPPTQIGEGKAENQNHAIIFTRGEALQIRDMNQDNYFEESFKMRNVLEEFRKGHEQQKPTILGIREHIFTGSVSSLAWFVSNQKTSYSTIGQRTLANPLRSSKLYHRSYPRSIVGPPTFPRPKLIALNMKWLQGCDTQPLVLDQATIWIRLGPKKMQDPKEAQYQIRWNETDSGTLSLKEAFLIRNPSGLKLSVLNAECASWYLPVVYTKQQRKPRIIISLTALLLKSGHPKKAPSIIQVDWTPPICNWIKCNTDGAAKGAPGPAGCVGIFRDRSAITLGFLFALLVFFYAKNPVVDNCFLVWRVRFHYGHPDIFDRIFHITRGGISKASKIINLSNDIFAGFNSTLRQGFITHNEYIQVGKGHDTGMNQISLFEAKVACENGEQTLSRDVYRLGQRFDFYRMMSFYFTTVGFYFSSMVTVLIVYAFLYGRLYMVLSGVEREILQSLNIHQSKALEEAMATQSVVQLGLLLLLPMVMEIGLERGFRTAVADFIIMQLQLASVFFTFQLGTKAHYYGRTLLHGGSKYRPTGRGLIVFHVKFADNYRMYSRSHFVKGLEILLLLIVYELYGESYRSSHLYLFIIISIWFLATSWLFAPFLFNPSGFDLLKTVDDWTDWKRWMGYPDGIGISSDRSWESWWDEQNEHLKYSNLRGKIIEIILAFRFFMYQYGIVYHMDITHHNKDLLVFGLSWLILIIILTVLKVCKC